MRRLVIVWAATAALIASADQGGPATVASPAPTARVAYDSIRSVSTVMPVWRGKQWASVFTSTASGRISRVTMHAERSDAECPVGCLPLEISVRALDRRRGEPAAILAAVEVAYEDVPVLRAPRGPLNEFEVPFAPVKLKKGRDYAFVVMTDSTLLSNIYGWGATDAEEARIWTRDPGGDWLRGSDGAYEGVFRLEVARRSSASG